MAGVVQLVGGILTAVGVGLALATRVACPHRVDLRGPRSRCARPRDARSCQAGDAAARGNAVANAQGLPAIASFGDKSAVKADRAKIAEDRPSPTRPTAVRSSSATWTCGERTAHAHRSVTPTAPLSRKRRATRASSYDSPCRRAVILSASTCEPSRARTAPPESTASMFPPITPEFLTTSV